MFAQPGDTLIATIDGSEQREKAVGPGSCGSHSSVFTGS